MQRYQRQKDISESDAKPKAQKCNIPLKEKRSPPHLLLLPLAAKKDNNLKTKMHKICWYQEGWNWHAWQKTLTHLWKGPGWGPYVPGYWLSLVFALKQDIAKLKQSACCRRYAKISLKEEEGAHCLQIGAYLTFLISWLIVKERVTGAVKSEEKNMFFLVINMF